MSFHIDLSTVNIGKRKTIETEIVSLPDHALHTTDPVSVEPFE